MPRIPSRLLLASALRAALATCLLLVLPLLGMRLSDQVHWTTLDFAVAGALLFGALFPFALVLRATPSIALRVAAGLALAAGLGLVWVNLAVGMIGRPGNPANLMYAGVLAVGAGGALLARFRPRGMARAMLATAAAMALAALVALAAGLGEPAHLVLAGHGLFVALFLASAGLFRRATHIPRPHPG